MQGSVISLGMLSAVWLMAGQGGRALRLLNDSTALPSSKAAWALPPQNSHGSPAGFVASGPDGEGYGTAGLSDGVRARQLRQQEKAVQVAIGGRSVPGGLRYFSSGSQPPALQTPTHPPHRQ